MRQITFIEKEKDGLCYKCRNQEDCEKHLQNAETIFYDPKRKNCLINVED